MVEKVDRLEPLLRLEYCRSSRHRRLVVVDRRVREIVRMVGGAADTVEKRFSPYLE